MAKILISYYSDYGEAMYDAISNKLLENGNDIFRFNINSSSVQITEWGDQSFIINEHLLNEIKNFNPDIVFNFNNCLPNNCYNILNNKCKICLIDADAPNVAFWNRDCINKHNNNFYWLGLQSYSKIMYEKYLNIKLEDNKNYIYFPPATVVKNENIKQDKKISFIGSNFYPLTIPDSEYFYSDDGIQVYQCFKENYFSDFEVLNNKYNCSYDDFQLIRAFYAGQERLKYLQQLTDLGLVIYGVRYWNKIAYYDFDIAKCFDKTPKITLNDNQYIYNSSKISINISHPLAKSSFSWRVMDIMASNSCLLMENKQDWIDLFGKYLSSATINAVIYKDRFDMRQKAINLLTNEELRLKCIKELNTAIEKNGRWELRFLQLEKFLNIKLLKINKQEPLYIYINRTEKKETTKIYSKTQVKKRFKLFIYLSILVFAQLPGLSCIISKYKREKLFMKIKKYWR